MDHCNHVSDWLKTLVNEFDFNMETLSEYLDLSAEQITELKNGNVDQLPQDTQAEQIQLFQCFSKDLPRSPSGKTLMKKPLRQV